MNYSLPMRIISCPLVCAALLLAVTLSARADVLTGTNGERFVGTLIQETATNIVFDSELAGRLTFPQEKIRDLLRTPVIEATNAAPALVSSTNSAASAPTNTVAWQPPGVGTDGSDWVRLKSGEWLRGDLKYIQNKEVEFDSDEMDQQTLKLRDVSHVYTAHNVFTQFGNLPPAYGQVIISNDLVNVLGEHPLALPRDELIGLTPSGGRTGLRDWAGSATLGLSMQSGNQHQTTFNTAAELSRRTPATTMLLDYLGNYSEANGEQSANNERINGSYDLRLNKDWFVRPAQLEVYHDPLANIAYRFTGGVGAGYYVLDRTGLEWTVFAGPGYQYTRFANVEANEHGYADTPAGLVNSKFKADITDRLAFIQSWQSIFTDRASGQYTHHAVTTLEFEVKRHMNLDVSLVWDYLQYPQPKSNGEIPEKNDLYLNVGWGVRF
jgi:hypothetical protein